MKKQLITLSILAAFAGMAHAQTNVTIYGIIDTGYAKETGSDWQMSFWDYNRLGFKGTEDLGGGMKATFQIEKRFDPGKGTTLGNDFDGASNVGLAGNWGAIRLGRINSLEVENFRRFDPFNEQGVSSTLLSTLNFNRLSNMARYDSPVWGGFSFSASYALGQNTDKATRAGTSQPGTSGGGLVGITDLDYADQLKATGSDNDGYALSLNYNNGPLLLNANYEVIPDSDKGYIWSLAGKYKIDSFTIGLGYQHTTNKGYRPRVTGSTFSKHIWGLESKQDNVFLAAEYETGPHKFAGILNWMRVSDIKDSGNGAYTGGAALANYGDGDVKKIGLGYWYSLSKRTSLYGQVAYTKYEDDALATFFRGSSFDTDKVTGIQFGINHKF